MNQKFSIASLILGSALFAVVGCGADATGSAANADELASASHDELTASAARLAGAYHGLGSVRPPSFQGVVFEADGRFFADVDTGIRCVVAPCPSHVRLTGRFTATRYLLRLSAEPGAETEAYHGLYRYELADGKLTLRRADSTWGAWVNELESAGSYCAEPVDCDSQMIARPVCVGTWRCSEARSCAWQCDATGPVAIWPADRTKLVAYSPGGGFTPPPPPGSTCRVGAEKYTLDIASGELSWEVCDFVDWSTPMHSVSGSRVLTAAELAQVDAVMGALTIFTGEVCGADKPLLTIEVTSKSQGTKTFFDDFYSCMDRSRTYVSNIDAVFSALRELTR
jgi:hypothetical protein